MNDPIQNAVNRANAAIKPSREELEQMVARLSARIETLTIERNYRPRMDDYERALAKIERYEKALKDIDGALVPGIYTGETGKILFEIQAIVLKARAALAEK